MRLTVGDATQEQPVTIAPDPRSAATADDFRAQEALQLQIRDKLSETNEAIVQLRAVRDQVDLWVKRAEGRDDLKQIPEAAESLKKKLQVIEDELIQHRAKGMQDTLNYPIKLNAKLAFLAGVVGSADTAPTQGSREVFTDVAARIDKQRDALKDVLYEDVIAFNTLVASYHLPAVTTPE